VDAIQDQKFIFTIPEVFAKKGFEGGKGIDGPHNTGF